MTEYSANELRRLDLVGAIIEASGKQGGDDVGATELLDSETTSEQERQFNDDVQMLESEGLLMADWRLSGLGDARVTARGHDEWDKLAALRADRPRLLRQMRNDYLKWIYTQADAGIMPNYEDFLSSGANYLGLPYNKNDLENTGKWLMDRGFIDGPSVWGIDGPILPTITAKGSDYVENVHDVHDSGVPTSGSTIGVQNNFSGNTNFAQGGEHIHQTINVGWLDGARELADAIDARLDEFVDTDIRTDLKASAAGLREAARAGATPAQGRALGSQIAVALAAGAGSAVAGELMKLVLDYLVSIPH